MEGLKTDYTKVGLDTKDRKMLDFSIKLTQKAHEIRQLYIDELKAVGFSDEQIVEIVQIAGYFNYINRVVDGLGGELEEWMKSK